MRDAQPIWMRPAPGERRPGHTREGIAATALTIADAEGFEAVSMRRIAAELGAGTMTLYHYVRNKDELVELMGDAIMGELLIPAGEVPDGWREGLAEIARRTRAIFARHPWVLEHISEGNQGTASPNALRHVEQSLAVASRTGLDREGQFELVALVDDYVFGFVVRTHEGAVFGEGEAPERRLDMRLRYLEEQLATGEFPRLRALMGDDVRDALTGAARRAADEERFERGLQILLDGIELDIERRRGG
jgi:AcrR family transcriptional regulator